MQYRQQKQFFKLLEQFIEKLEWQDKHGFPFVTKTLQDERMKRKYIRRVKKKLMLAKQLHFMLTGKK